MTKYDILYFNTTSTINYKSIISEILGRRYRNFSVRSCKYFVMSQLPFRINDCLKHSMHFQNSSSPPQANHETIHDQIKYFFISENFFISKLNNF